MASEAYRALVKRVQLLKRRFLPPMRANGAYTNAQQDSMRALRLLVHAEVENFLEDRCDVMVGDLQREIFSKKVAGHPIQHWAKQAIKKSREAASSNNGVTRRDILAMFSDLGLSEDVINECEPVLLDRLTTFGRSRGEVAHRSAVKASYQLNRVREEKALDELLALLSVFDELVVQRRLSNYF